MSRFPVETAEDEAASLNRLRFSSRLEARFEADGRAQRIRVARVTILVALALYDGFLLTDWEILPDIFPALAVLRLCVFTPLALLVVWALPRTRRDWQIDAMVAGATVLAVLLPSVAMVFSASDHVLIYQFGTMLTITYMGVVQRVRFRMAAACLALVLLIQFWTVGLRPEIDAMTYQFILRFYLFAVALILMGAFVVERMERSNFLERVRVRRLMAEIEDQARRDQLTGLFNRHHLATVSGELAREGADQPLAALLIDIDHFKRFNDTQGHLSGDQCIRRVSRLVRDLLERDAEAIGGGGLAFRFGGEEFLVLLPGVAAPDAARLGEEIRRRVEEARIPHAGLGPDAVVTASIGVAAARRRGAALDALVDEADIALYRAKNDGRNRVAIG